MDPRHARQQLRKQYLALSKEGRDLARAAIGDDDEHAGSDDEVWHTKRPRHLLGTSRRGSRKVVDDDEESAAPYSKRYQGLIETECDASDDDDDDNSCDTNSHPSFIASSDEEEEDTQVVDLSQSDDEGEDTGMARERDEGETSETGQGDRTTPHQHTQETGEATGDDAHEVEGGGEPNAWNDIHTHWGDWQPLERRPIVLQELFQGKEWLPPWKDTTDEALLAKLLVEIEKCPGNSVRDKWEAFNKRRNSADNIDKVKVKGWLLTMNNYSSTFERRLLQLTGSLEHWTDIAVGYEVGPECGTPHIHAWIQLRGQRGKAYLKKLFPYANLTPCVGIGSRERTIKYVMKDKDDRNWWSDRLLLKHSHRDPVTHNTAEDNRKKKRKVLTEVQNGQTNMIQLRNQDPELYAKAWKGLQLIVRPSISWRTEEPREVYWYFGDTASYKGYRGLERAHAIAEVLQEDPRWMGVPRDDLIWEPALGCHETLWFDGYVQQPIVLLDDFRAKSMPFMDLLKLMDNRDKLVQIKGSTTAFTARYVIITSARRPEECYKGVNDTENMAQIVRRLWYVANCINKTSALEFQSKFHYPDAEQRDLDTNSYWHYWHLRQDTGAIAPHFNL